MRELQQCFHEEVSTVRIVISFAATFSSRFERVEITISRHYPDCRPRDPVEWIAAMIEAVS
jgi:hypothetical protein